MPRKKKELVYFGRFRPFCCKFTHFLVYFYRPKYCGSVPQLTKITYDLGGGEGVPINFAWQIKSSYLALYPSFRPGRRFIGVDPYLEQAGEVSNQETQLLSLPYWKQL